MEADIIIEDKSYKVSIQFITAEISRIFFHLATSQHPVMPDGIRGQIVDVNQVNWVDINHHNHEFLIYNKTPFRLVYKDNVLLRIN